MLVDGSLLRRFPADWQSKIRAEFQSKLGLCISDADEALRAAEFTWQTLLGGVDSRDNLAQHFQVHLHEYAGDYADWVLEFIGQAVHHYRATEANTEGGALAGAAPDEAGHGDSQVAVSVTCLPREGAPASADAATAEGDSAGVNAGACVFGGKSSGGLKSFGSSAGGNVVFGSPGGSSDGVGRGSFWGSSTSGGSGKSDGFGGASCYDQPDGNPDDGTEAPGVDALDDTLDNLILKQRMNKMKGRGNVPLGARTRSNKFPARGHGGARPGDEGNSRPPVAIAGVHPRSAHLGGGPSPFRSAAPPFAQHGPPPGKVPKLCMNLPDCPYGDKCRFLHPQTAICRHWPKCAFGPKCAYTHPAVPCRFNRACTNPTCNYKHSD